MKLYLQAISAFIVMSNIVVTTAYADNYLLIGSDSNNCQLHHTANGKTYVTGSDCLCMQKSHMPKSVEWVISFGNKVRPLGCYPEIDRNAHAQNNPVGRPNNCAQGDHCSQYDCLEVLYDDNKPQTQQQMTLAPQQCVDEDFTPLGICDQFGRNCQFK